MTAAPHNLQLELPLGQIADFCHRWGIARLEIFGSVLRDDFRHDNDVDFLFTPGPVFQRDRVYGPWMSNHMAEELSGLIGRPVDLLERSRVERMNNWIKRR